MTISKKLRQSENIFITLMIKIILVIITLNNKRLMISQFKRTIILEFLMKYNDKY